MIARGYVVVPVNPFFPFRLRKLQAAPNLPDSIEVFLKSGKTARTGDLFEIPFSALDKE